MNQPNRRSQERKSVKADAWIAMAGDRWSSLNTVDVSTGGFAFISQEQFVVDATRQFRLQLPDDGGVMHVKGRISHCIPLGIAPGFRVGVQALKVDVVDNAGAPPRPAIPDPNPLLDLVVARTIGAPKEKIWAAWTTPDLLKQWFTPAPWTTVECDIDLRVGGTFRTVMQSPTGQLFPGIGTYLEIIPNEKLVWTNALLPDFRPASLSATDDTEFHFTTMISLEGGGNITDYTAMVMHADEDARKRHEVMGFHTGWNVALDQLTALVNRI